MEDQVSMGRLMERVDYLDSELATIRKEVIVGNGAPSLVVRLDRLEQELKRVDELKDEWRKTAMGLGVGVLFSIGGFVWAIITHSIAVVAH